LTDDVRRRLIGTEAHRNVIRRACGRRYLPLTRRGAENIKGGKDRGSPIGRGSGLGSRYRRTRRQREAVQGRYPLGRFEETKIPRDGSATVHVGASPDFIPARGKTDEVVEAIFLLETEQAIGTKRVELLRDTQHQL